MHVVLLGADFQTIDVVNRLHRTHAIGQLAKAHSAEGKAHEAMTGQVFQHLLTDRPVKNRVGMIEIAKQERDVEDLQIGIKIRHHRT